MQTCPAESVLNRFLIADLSPSEADKVAEHIDGCTKCQVKLDQLSAPSDLSELRHAGPPRSGNIEAVEPGLQRVLAEIRSESTSHVLTDETTEAESTRLPAPLGPPRRDGDIGSLDSYCIRREIGRGGMGIVFEAFDPHLDRAVAIKLLRPDRSDAASRSRFVREAQSAARLRHEHVVMVYCVVNPPAAPPYLVMELIAGETLRQRIDREQRIHPREAAALCVQIAQGLAAAHDAGLVHRDIKPSNVLLEEARELNIEGRLRTTPERTGRFVAKLTDFGLARLTELPPGSTLTREGFIAGTPAYMSPEQSQQPDRADARSDVYALGVTLYEMLTGDVPFHGEPHMILRQVELDEPPAPRRLNDAVPVNLETICLKAMAKEPDRRYPSAREFAADLRRWLGGQPIHARPAGSIERLRLWTRRSPRVATLSATVFGLMFLLAAGSSVAALWIAAEQRATERERLAAISAGIEAQQSALAARTARDDEARQAAAARRAEQAARESAEAARVAEERAKALASAASDGRSIAMDSLSALIGKVYERLGDTAGTVRLREELVQTAIDGLERVSENAEKDSSLDRNLVLAHQRLGLIYIDAGRTADARAQFERSRELAERLLAAEPGNPLLERDLARAFGKLGDIAYHNLDDDAANDSYRQALAIYESHVARDPQSVPGREGLSITHNNLARLLERQGKLVAAREHAETSLGIAEELAASQSDPRFQRGLMVTLSRVGLVCERQFDFDAAGRHYRRQVALAEQLVAQEPTNSTWIGDLSITLQNLSKLLERQWDYAEAAQYAHRSLSVAEARAEKDPENAVAQRNVAVGYHALGDIQVHRNADEARDSYRRAFEIATQQARRDPSSAQKAADLTEICSKLAALEARAAHYSQAAIWIRLGREQLDELSRASDMLRVPTLLEWQSSSLDDLAAWENADRAIRDVESSRDLPPAVRSRLERIHALELVRAGRYADAAAAAERLLQKQAASPDDWIAAVSVYAACMRAPEQLAESVADSTLRTAQPPSHGSRYAQAAMDAARRLFQAHPTVFQNEHKIVEFDPLRALPAYAAMLNKLRHADNAVLP